MFLFQIFQRRLDLFAQTSLRSLCPASYLYVKPSLLTHQPVCFKSKGKHAVKASAKKISIDQIPSNLLDALNYGDIKLDYENLYEQFAKKLNDKLVVSLTPEIIGNIVKNLLSAETYNQDPRLIVDVSNKKQLLSASKSAVINFLAGSKSKKDMEAASSLVNDIGPNSFSVRLKSQITRQEREELVKHGVNLLHHSKRDMDKVYQKVDKILKNKDTVKAFSEDKVFIAREYFKQDIKSNFKKMEDVWDHKKLEIMRV